ncbi:phage tail assembly chaperone [Peptostreptococcus sp.]|uniref:phage tail assembly chaperone n=1 Tax=Peptostreptococcus sp. TaxID=1262 RepID=UPI001D584337|nr:hypothetical protein [Peptostreptococcus sp.]MBS5595665.1 hypothetical protein [Peptostreptococcus sp.]
MENMGTMSIIDLLLSKERDEFLDKRTKVELKSLSKKLGAKVEVEIRRMTLSQEQELEKFGYKPSVDKEGKMAMEGDYRKKKLMTINNSVYYNNERLFTNKQLQDHFGAGTALDLIEIILTPDEISDLYDKYDDLVNDMIKEDDIKN